MLWTVDGRNRIDVVGVETVRRKDTEYERYRSFRVEKTSRGLFRCSGSSNARRDQIVCREQTSVFIVIGTDREQLLCNTANTVSLARGLRDTDW